MEAQDALTETGKVKLTKGSEDYAYLERGVLYWHNNGDPEVVKLDLIGLQWQPYHDKLEIRPKEEGELWLYDGKELYSAKYHHTKLNDDNEVIVVGDNGICGQIEGMIHGQNGWIRICPSVPDENVERIVIEGIKWVKHSCETSNLSYPTWPNNIAPMGIFNGSMKMILEIPKEKS